MVFSNIIKLKPVQTLFPLASMIITFDSKRAVSVTREDDETFYVKQYELTGEVVLPVFEEMITGTYIKLKEVE
jgi:hypothetical protein